MTDYERTLDKAIAEEMKGNWRSARKEYARAGGLLLNMSEDMDPADRMRAIQSVKRLLAIAEKMQALENAANIAKSASSDRTSAAKGKTQCNSEEEDEYEYLPSPSPNVHFDDIAGLKDTKRLIREEIIEPALHPDIYQRFHQKANGGILLYGPPGTGKTMLARAIATEIDADFYAVRCSDIVGKYFGEAERRLKALFRAARNSGNAIIFFDEFEALGSKRGGHSTVMNRIIPELLAQMDGFDQHDGRLIIIAATNRPWDLDSAFFRPSRLTHHVYVPLPDYDARLYLIKRKLQHVPQQGVIDFDLLAKASEGFNCADVVALCDRTTRGPIRRGIDSGNDDQYITPADVLEAIEISRSSVQPEDLKALAKWQSKKSA